MSKPCDCEDSNSKSTFMASVHIPKKELDQKTECTALVHETVCVQAEITITPHVEIGCIEIFCEEGPVIGSCRGKPSQTGTCSFKISQNICVRVPLTFSATATAEPAGIICGTPSIGHCSTSTEEEFIIDL